MSLEDDVSKLTLATTELLKAVNVQKSYLDAAAKAAIAGVTAQGAIAPTPGKSPVGNASGKFDPAWLDPTLPLAAPISVGAVNKYGYSFVQGGQGQSLYKLATMPGNGINTFASLRIDAMLGNWLGSELTAMTIILGSRNDTTGLSVDWNTTRFVPTSVRFVAYKETNGEISVYLFFLAGSFAQAALQIMGIQTVTYAAPVAVSSVTGTLVWDSSAGPDNAIVYRAPRSRGIGASSIPGVLNGTSFDSVVEVRSQDGYTGNTSFLAGAPRQDTMTAGTSVEVLRHGIAGNSGINYAGYMSWYATVGNGTSNSTYYHGYSLVLRARDVGSATISPTILSLRGDGLMTVPGTVAVGFLNTEAQGAQKFTIHNCLKTYVVSGSHGSEAGAALNVATHNVTGSSIRTGGTVNTSGNDYAEYITKNADCGVVSPGQIVGIDGDNKITDKWADAVMFSIKSTAPSFVGGDSWATSLGARPLATAGMKPVKPVRISDEMGEIPKSEIEPIEQLPVAIKAGDTDEEWEAKMAAYDAAVLAWEAASEADVELQAEYDAALEAARSRVDRIAIAGRVPVNVLGAEPGDYIVPVQDGEGIQGLPVKEDDMTLKQYLRAVGQVIAIEDDGRAYVMVKAV